MSFKGFLREIQDLRDGLGSISRRSFEVKVTHHYRSRSHTVVPDASPRNAEDFVQSKWAGLPSELLRDIIQRLESSECSWPSRKHVVACAAVCCSWRDVTKELVKSLEVSSKITFPISLKQPGPRDAAMQCFIKRDPMSCTYYLYLGLSPNAVENGKFLLAARKVRRPTSADYIISLSPDDFSRGSNMYAGKLRSNFLGTKFLIYDSQPQEVGAVASSSEAGHHVGSKQVSPRVPAGIFNVAHIGYELNVLGTRGPRRMQCTLYSIPTRAVECGGCVPTPTESSKFISGPIALPLFSRSKTSVADYSAPCDDSISFEILKDGPLILKNKTPRWHEQLQCWCLNFRGRVTVASVKNFQLVAATDPSVSQIEHDKVLLQFGKVGKDTFTMDFRYPLSAFQSFAICLSSFDTKLACE